MNAVLNVLSTKAYSKMDLNDDDILSLEELREYIVDYIVMDSFGRQVPAIINYNVCNNDWTIKKFNPH